MTWPLIAAATVLGIPAVFIGWLLLFGNRPVYHRYRNVAEYEGAITQLMHLMADGAVYIIEHEDSSRFLQFRRSGRDLIFGFPDAPWSREHFDRVASALSHVREDVRIVPTRSGQVTRFLEVRLRGTPDQIGRDAVRVARTAAAALELPGDAPLKGHYEGGFDPEAYLARFGPSVEQLAKAGPRPLRAFFRRHLRSLRRDAGMDVPPPAA